MSTTTVPPPIVTPNGSIRYRFIDAPEWDRLVPIFAEHGQAPPSPAAAVTVVAEDESGSIVGLLVGQFVLHAEPLWIAPSHRGKVSWRTMVHALEDLFRGKVSSYFSFSSRETERFCLRNRMTRLPYTGLWMKAIEGEPCGRPQAGGVGGNGGEED